MTTKGFDSNSINTGTIVTAYQRLTASQAFVYLYLQSLPSEQRVLNAAEIARKLSNGLKKMTRSTVSRALVALKDLGMLADDAVTHHNVSPRQHCCLQEPQNPPIEPLKGSNRGLVEPECVPQETLLPPRNIQEEVLPIVIEKIKRGEDYSAYNLCKFYGLDYDALIAEHAGRTEALIPMTSDLLKYVNPAHLQNAKNRTLSFLERMARVGTTTYSFEGDPNKAL